MEGGLLYSLNVGVYEGDLDAWGGGGGGFLHMCVCVCVSHCDSISQPILTQVAPILKECHQTKMSKKLHVQMTLSILLTSTV